MSGCLSSYETGKTSNIITLGFVPDFKIPKGDAGGNFVNAVLAIIVSELMDLFVDGVTVEYNYPIEELQGSVYDSPAPGPTTVRVMVIALIADLPARAKLVNSKDGGIGGCYRYEADTAVSGIGTSSYYFPNFMKQYHNPPVQKDRHYAENVSSKCVFKFII